MAYMVMPNSRRLDKTGRNTIIVGPGSLGTLFASYLSANGFPVTLIDHDPARASTISSKPIKITLDPAGDSSFETPVRCMSSPSSLQQPSPDYLVFCVKSYDTEEAAKQCSFLVGARTHVVSLQNGLGNLETLEQFFGTEKVIAAITWEGSTLVSPGRVYHTARGITKVAPIIHSSAGAAENFSSILRQSGLHSMVATNAREILWGKLVVDSAINPLSALTRMRNGELLLHNGTRKLLSEIANETFYLGHRTLDIDPDIGEENDPSTFVLKAAAATAKNQSSMLQDVLKKRRTEIDFMNGSVYALSREHGMDSPLNETMYFMVKSLDDISKKNPRHSMKFEP